MLDGNKTNLMVKRRFCSPQIIHPLKALGVMALTMKVQEPGAELLHDFVGLSPTSITKEDLRGLLRI